MKRRIDLGGKLLASLFLCMSLSMAAGAQCETWNTTSVSPPSGTQAAHTDCSVEIMENTYLGQPSSVVYQKVWGNGYAPLLHTGSQWNLYLGLNAGFAALGNVNISNNTGIGNMALLSLTTGSGNTAVGREALRATTTGAENTAIGENALPTNMTGSFNTSVGAGSLLKNEEGNFNAALGQASLFSSVTGEANTAVGNEALFGNVAGDSNTAIGAYALNKIQTGSANVAIGLGALRNHVDGNSNTVVGTAAMNNGRVGTGNTAIGRVALQWLQDGVLNAVLGYQAGLNLSIGNSNTILGGQAALNLGSGSGNTVLGRRSGVNLQTGNRNLYIDNPGVAVEDDAIRIGKANHQQTFIAGITETTLATGIPVCISTGDQLGICPSSLRYKEAVDDVGTASSMLYDLRPVSFQYRWDPADLLQYGLIAEEVAEVAPELVAFDEAGEPFAVRYLLLTPLLVEELQQKNTEIEKLESRVASLEERLAQIEALLAAEP